MTNLQSNLYLKRKTLSKALANFQHKQKVKLPQPTRAGGTERPKVTRKSLKKRQIKPE